MLYSYATSVNSLVIGVDSTRYIINRKDICNILAGVGRPGRVQRRPPLLPWRYWSGHQLELGFPGSPGCKVLDLEAVIWLQPAAWLRNRSLSLGLTGAQWLRVGQATTLHARPGGRQLFTSTVHQYLPTWVNSWASNQHRRQATSNPTGHCHRITTVTENPLGRSKTWAKAQVWNSLRVSCAWWSANLRVLHQVWRSCKFLVLLLIRLFNYKTKCIPFLNQLRSIQLKDLLWVILLIKISIQLLWGSVNESRTIVVTSLINIWTWQDCLNYLQSHLRHSNHFSTSQSPSALLSFSPDQLFVLSLWLNFWTWQDCLNILHSYPRHSNYCP